MRLLTVGVRNFRGVRERIVNLDRQGVTIIEGPNEVGKTSMADAVDILIRYADSSKAAEVLAIKPAGEDVGTEIWVDMEVGPYRFAYSKRYHKSPATELEIVAPKPEQRTGRDAHDRVAEILGAHADMTLWAALKIQQRPVEARGADKMPRLKESRSLRAALDREAGGVEPLAPDTLLDRVEKEYQRYFTAKTGRESAALHPLTAAVSVAEEQLQVLTAHIEAAEADEERLRVLEAERQASSSRAADGESEARLAAERLKQVVALEARHREALSRQMALTNEHTALLAQADRRRELTAQRQGGEAKLADVHKKAAEAEAALAAAQAEESQRRREHDAARLARDAARRDEDQALADQQDLARQQERGELAQRLERFGTLMQALADREAARAAITVTPDQLAVIHDCQRRLFREEAALGVGSPTATVVAPMAATILVNGEPEALAPDQQAEYSVQDTLKLGLPGGIAVTIQPGASVSDLHKKRQAAYDRLMRALAAHQLEDVDSAERAVQKAAELDRAIAESRERAEDLLGGQAAGQLEERLRILQAGHAAHLAELPTGYSGPRDAEDAQRRAGEARERLRAAEGQLQQASAAAAGAEKASAQAVRECQRLEADRQALEASLASVRAQLEELAAVQSDQALAEALAAAAAALAHASQEAEALAAQLLAQNPDAVRMEEENARALVERTRQEVSQITSELAECRGRLEQAGRDEWYEQWPLAEQALAASQQALAEMRRQAAAAQLLHQTLVRLREVQQRAYRQPLEAKIAELGKVVYGPDLAVEVDDGTLSVTRRTLGGVTLDLQQLSAGAREQMELLERLAAAQLVAPGEGAPVILDDTLGFTDEDRLRRMAVVLNRIGAECQVIVLTSSAHRYARIGHAKRIQIAAARLRA